MQAARRGPRGDFRRNLLAVSAWETFWGFGAACVSNAIVLGLLAQLTTSRTLIGAFGLVQLLGIPALFATTYLNRRLHERKRVTALLWAIQVVNWALLGGALSLSPAGPATILSLLFVVRSIIAVTNALAVAPTNELLAGAFGPRWGTAQGIQLFCNRSAGVLGGLVAATVLTRPDFPRNFGLTFLLGGAFLTVSNAAVLGIVERPLPGDRDRVLPFGVYLRRLVRAAATDPAFVRFLAVIVLLSGLAMAQGFYVVYALDRLALPPAATGLFTTVTFAANGVGGLLAGVLGDRLGHLRLLLAALALHLASLLLVLATATLLEFCLVLAVGALATVATSIASANVTVSFAPAGEKGSYIALTQLVNYPATALATLLGGVAIDAVGYRPLFTACLAFPLAAAGLVWRMRAAR